VTPRELFLGAKAFMAELLGAVLYFLEEYLCEVLARTGRGVRELVDAKLLLRLGSAFA
jgi:hypothetical protein